MKSYRISKILAVFVSIVGVVVMLGWMFNIAVLKSILPNWTTMKFSTALCFFLSGVSLYFIVKTQEKEPVIAQIVLPVAGLVIILFMSTFLLSSLPGIELGAEDIFILEKKGPASGYIPGRPSVGTMFAFILVAITSLMAMKKSERLNRQLLYIGWGILSVGGLAVFGYILNVPLLYYNIKGWSNSMACHTSILFALLGIGLVLSIKKK